MKDFDWIKVAAVKMGGEEKDDIKSLSFIGGAVGNRAADWE